jgi:hypothetical protein
MDLDLDFDFEAEKKKWRDPGEDFHTLAIHATADPVTFTKQKSLVMPIFPSSVFTASKSAALEQDESVRQPPYPHRS